MIGRFRTALYNAIGSLDSDAAGQAGGDGTNAGSAPGHAHGSSGGSSSTLSSGTGQRVKYAYQRPIFLQLFTEDEIQVTADHLVRPIMVPRDIQILPWFTGYAEAINAGKSLRNEDQASFHRGVLRTSDCDEVTSEEWEIPYIFFGTFDGHAGSGCAVAAANELHQVLHKRLLSVLHHLVPPAGTSAPGAGPNTRSTSGHPSSTTNHSSALWFPSREISKDSLIVGALEAAFWDMDQMIGDDKRRYKMLGGCTVIVSLFILGKLYVSNAGDSRAVLCRDGVPYPMSYDFTPVSERQRLQQLGYQKPQLLGNEYTSTDFCRRPLRKDVGTQMLVREAHMTGWTYKEITTEDLKFPVVYGEGKRSRLLATIGVTRGFGDHDLKAQSQVGNVYIKPFLTPQPEVRVLNVDSEDEDEGENEEEDDDDEESSNAAATNGVSDAVKAKKKVKSQSQVTESDVLVMATDGLWDVVSNQRVAEIVHNGLKLYEDADETRRRYRYISIAQDLVMSARGKLVERTWRRSDGSAATIDDIAVTVIPVHAYKGEYRDWKRQCRLRRAGRAHRDSARGASAAQEGGQAVNGNDDRARHPSEDLEKAIDAEIGEDAAALVLAEESSARGAPLVLAEAEQLSEDEDEDTSKDEDDDEEEEDEQAVK